MVMASLLSLLSLLASIEGGLGVRHQRHQHTVDAKCPGSPSLVHASSQVQVKATAKCCDVMAEMRARVDGQYDKWFDPHNNGTYTLTEEGPNELQLSRVTGNLKYTDKMIFTFTDVGGNCVISGCSESQVLSVKDFSTNYCNLRMLYCGEEDGCRPVQEPFFSVEEVQLKTSFGAGRDKDECLVALASAQSIKKSIKTIIETPRWSKCPGSPALVHAHAKVQVKAAAQCSDVEAEMRARVDGQYDKWYDPHNNGTYSVTWVWPNEIQLSRVTGNLKYKDKMRFRFSDDGNGNCVFTGCSESQVTSFKDFSTNYCNLRMLYCGEDDGCRPVLEPFSVEELQLKTSLGAGSDKDACITM